MTPDPLRQALDHLAAAEQWTQAYAGGRHDSAAHHAALALSYALLALVQRLNHQPAPPER